MIDIRLLYPVEKVDGRALRQTTNLIMRYLLQNSNIGAIDIHRSGIIFSRFLINKGKIPYEGNNLEFKNNIVYFTGDQIPDFIFNYEKSVLLMNILLKLRQGMVGKFSLK